MERKLGFSLKNSEEPINIFQQKPLFCFELCEELIFVRFEIVEVSEMKLRLASRAVVQS